MFDRDRLRRAGEITAEEARAKYNAAQAHGDYDIYKGLTLWAPNVNIFRGRKLRAVPLREDHPGGRGAVHGLRADPRRRS